MLKHEKKAFWKFFSIYFGSVALLIVAAGYFYFIQVEKSLIKKEHFSMIEYTRQVKMKLVHTDKHIHHTIKNIVIKDFNMDNFTITEESFQKYMPFSWDGGYILVTKDTKEYIKNLSLKKYEIISVQVLLLLCFAIISYLLAVRALKPMQEAITKLDNFSKDLIHDLNTPITSILLNVKILETKGEFTNNKAINRIKQSAQDIGELHNNLTVLLEEDTMLVAQENILDIVKEVVSSLEKIYTDINIEVSNDNLFAIVNRDALKQVLSNIVSNACKYNKKNGSIKIYTKEKKLYIKDSGLGIKNPNNIFERSYTEHTHGHGIGLDIVKRLCEAMDIEIEVQSELTLGTTISLEFRY